MAEKVVAHFGSQFAGMELVYEIEKIPLGTGGAVRQALRRCSTEHVFVSMAIHLILKTRHEALGKHIFANHCRA